MKKVFTLFAIIALNISVFAQTPQKMSYQAVVRNSGGVLVDNQSVGMKISILQGSASGTPVYVETQTATTNVNGLVTIEIGGGTPVTGTFSGINWSGGTYFIKTETDPTGGTNYTISGTSQILSVPYALYSATAKTADYNYLTNKPVLFDGSWTSLTGMPSFATVASSGSYNDLINKPVLYDGSWASIIGKPTTLAGYGITNAMSTSHAANGINATMLTNWNNAFGWGNHAGLYRPITYVPAWSEIASKPTTVAGYGITDAVTKSGDQTITGKTTLEGTTLDMEAPLFEVKNKDGQTIFAVYNEGVRIWVADGAKGSKGGFAIQGIDTKTDYMVIKPDSANFYVREISPTYSSSFNIIGIKPSLPRTSLLFARTDIVGVSAVMNLYNDLLVDGNISVEGTINTTITDVEGNIYNIVEIGTQTWMAENLKTTKFNDGADIPLVTNTEIWGSLSSPAYCWFDNDEINYREPYGALYNWYSLNTGNLCPTGWHIPDNTEWTTLTDYLGGQDLAGGKLKETGTAHWNTPNTGATDEVNFTALPGGARGGGGVFNIIGDYGYWWTANAHSFDPEYAWGFVLQYNSAEVIRADYYYKRNGFSVRCIKD